MAIGKDKTQVLLTLTKEDKAELQRIADNENRSFTNLINTIIKNYLKSQREVNTRQNNNRVFFFAISALCIAVLRLSTCFCV